MLVQIYGVTTVRDAVDVARLGADHVGLVVDERIDAWDCVDEATARAIAEQVEEASLVALSLSTDPGRIARTAALLDPTIVHLARAHRMTTGALARLRDQLAPKQLMLTVPVVGEGAMSLALRLASLGDYLLLDTAHPKTGVVGATGLVHAAVL